MEDSNCNAGFEDNKTTLLSTELVHHVTRINPGKNYFKNKLQVIDSPYFYLENFKIS